MYKRQSFDNEEMRGSMQQILGQNVGEYVVVEFLIGTSMIMRKQGILYHVGVSYVTPVSYTHLDVYKRQGLLFGNARAPQMGCYNLNLANGFAADKPLGFCCEQNRF